MRSIEELLANVDDIMDRAKAVPFSSDKCIVDARELNAVIDEIRMNLPQEIHQSSPARPRKPTRSPRRRRREPERL